MEALTNQLRQVMCFFFSIFVCNSAFFFTYVILISDFFFVENVQVKWDYFDYQGPHPREANGFSDANRGIVLVVGYVPGLKVDAIPLIHPKSVS